MEIIRVGDEKMKLILAAGDMKRYGITEVALSAGTAARRRALSRLLEEVGRKTGIDTLHARTLLEAFPDGAGGYEIFVTVTPLADTEGVIYRFPAFPPLREAAKRMQGAERAALYTMGGGEYFLSLSLPALRKDGALSRYSFLEEYGERERSPLFSAYIREYGTCLCAENAIPYILSGEEKFSV